MRARRLRRDNESLRSKNDSNLQQTQQGIRTFRDEIDALKAEVQREKGRYREAKDLLQDAEAK